MRVREDGSPVRPPRRSNLPPSARRLGLAELGGTAVAPRKPARRANYERALDKAVVEARDLLAGNDWQEATASALVGLYVLRHQEVYGVDPEELVQDYGAARSMADRCCRDLGSAGLVAQMIHWKFAREKKKSEFASRVGWRLMFGKSMITDFKVAAKSRR